MGRCALLQGIFPTEGLNPGLLNCRWSPKLQADSLSTDSPEKRLFLV